jgi:acetyltransferase
LRRFGFAGQILLVNPKYEELYGERCYPSVSALPSAPDQLVMVVPAAAVATALEEAGQRGTRSAVVMSGGFSEAGSAEGRAQERLVIEMADRYGIQLCGPNCLGNISMAKPAVTYAEMSLEDFRPGGLACVSQSSGVMGATLRYATQRGVGLSYGVACGNEGNRDVADYVGFLSEDPDTRVIALFVETVRRPAAFAAACRKAAAAGKPVMVLTVGQSEAGRAAAAAHTGGLAGSREAFDALCEQLDIIQVRGTDAFVELAELATRAHRPFGPGIAMVSLSGGVRGLLCDIGERTGLPFAELQPRTLDGLNRMLGVGSGIGNPLDIGWGGLSSLETYLACLRLILEDPAVDVIAVQEELPKDETGARRAEGFVQMVELARAMNKQLVFYSRGSYTVTDYARALHERIEAPFLQELNRTVEAVASLRTYEQQRPSISPEPPPRPPEHAAAAVWRDRLARASGPLSDADGFALLEAYGVPTAPWRLAHDADEAVAMAVDIGWPVAVKLSTPGLTHKTEVGGIRLGLADAAAVRAAAADLLAAAPTSAAVLVQRMAEPGGTEILLSCRTDPQYGPLLVVGLGGVWVEVMQAVRFVLGPVDYERARALIETLPGRAILTGVRGRPAADIDALANAAAALSHLAFDLGRTLDTIEINPFILGRAGGGGTAVDVVCLPVRSA